MNELKKHQAWRGFLASMDESPLIASERLRRLEEKIFLGMQNASTALALAEPRPTTAHYFLRWSTTLAVACLCGMLLGHFTQYQYNDNQTTTVAMAYMSSSPWNRAIH